MRVVFMGTPEFGLPTLEALADDYSLAGVVTQPDRPAGRGRRLRPSPVKARALELRVPVLEPARVKSEEGIQAIRSLAPALIVVAAYGQILPPAVLELPQHGCLNVHASLLPRWRGAAPIQAAILHGDAESGATIMRMDAGLDTGPIVAQRATPIGPDETGGELGARLADLGARLLSECLPRYLAGALHLQDQDGSQATYAPVLVKSDGSLDPSRTAEALARQVRAFEPWPGSFIQWTGGRLLVHAAHASGGDGAVGTLIVVDGFPALVAHQGVLVLDRVQPPGRRPMPGDAFLRGNPEFVHSAPVASSPS